jgi:hypothetical protein
MKPKRTFYGLFFCMVVAALCGLSGFAASQTSTSRDIGPGHILVKSAFGAPIYGYDIDRNGTEGILNEWVQQSNGNVLSAVETFDQATGKIIKVLSKTDDQTDQFETLGIVGGSVAMIEHDTANSNGFIVKRAYPILHTINQNKYTGFWKPPFDANDIIEWVSVNQETPVAAFLVLDNLGANAKNYVIASDVAKNTFGPLIELTDPNFEPYGSFPALGVDIVTNTAVVSGDIGCRNCRPDVGLVDLASGQVTTFAGVGIGTVNGLAVDSEDGIAVTTTNNDANVEFYDLKSQTGFSELLPGATNLQTGQDVEYDPIHKLFLVGQPVSSTGAGSSIQVYDPRGNFVESVNGLNFSGYIALNPKFRGGFVNSNDPVGLLSFTY